MKQFTIFTLSLLGDIITQETAKCESVRELANLKHYGRLLDLQIRPEGNVFSYSSELESDYRKIQILELA